jgi:hypothetical protein
LPALLDVVDRLTPSGAKVQILAASHAPLLLASLEPRFDREQDRIIHFDIRNDKVFIDRSEFAQQGDATNWLVSEFFGLRQARSKEAEDAIEAAEAWMRGERQILPADLSTQDKIDQRLRATVPGHDPFWPRWIVHAPAQRRTRAQPAAPEGSTTSATKQRVGKRARPTTSPTRRAAVASSRESRVAKKRRASK